MFTEMLEQYKGNFLVFTGRFCGYCTAAKRLLTQKEMPFVEISFDEHPQSYANKLLKLQCIAPFQ